jgi:hypothetical protein
MFEVILQILSAIVLATLAIRVKVTTARRQRRDWGEIVSHFRGGHAELSKLANLNQSYKGKGADTSEVWTAIDGTCGLWKIYTNTRVLVEAVDYVDDLCASEPKIAERLKQARVAVRKAQRMVPFILIVTLLPPLRVSVVISALTSYVTAVQIVSGVIDEFFPNLIRTYRYFITRDYSDAAADPVAYKSS